MELATTIYFWEDGEVAAYGLRKHRPNRRVFARRTLDGQVKHTDITGLIAHVLRVGDAPRFRYGTCRLLNGNLDILEMRESVLDDFLEWAKQQHPRHMEAARLL